MYIYIYIISFVLPLNYIGLTVFFFCARSVIMARACIRGLRRSVYTHIYVCMYIYIYIYVYIYMYTYIYIYIYKYTYIYIHIYVIYISG